MLLLASASPRRHELLNQIAVPHRISAAHIDESRRPGEAPTAYVRRLALEKARAVAERHPGATVLGADTTVTLEEQVLNKPADLTEAAAMLRLLANRAHLVHTGLALLQADAERTHVETTEVRFTAIPESELATYLASGDSLDKAGAYGIQGFAARWVSGLQGDYFNVVGLPLAATARLLREAGALP